jgi:mRNA interferase RelE/StbE
MGAIFQPAAIRALAAVPKKDRASLLRKLERFAADPFAPNSSAKPLKGQPQAVRIRQGDWRAICRIDRANETVIIEAIGNRREIYQ